MKILVSMSQSTLFIWIIATIVTSIIYFIEPVYNVVVKKEYKEQKSRVPFCRLAKISSAVPQKENLKKNVYQKQLLKLEFEDKSLNRTYESSSQKGYDVNETIMFNVNLNSLMSCGGEPSDRIYFNDSDSSFTTVSQNAKNLEPKTIYTDKHGKQIEPNRERINPALIWLIIFVCLLILCVIIVVIDYYQTVKK